MSELLAMALVSRTLQDASRGDTQAWVFLTRRSPMLELTCSLMGLDTLTFCETMETLQRSQNRARIAVAIKQLRNQETQLMRRLREGREVR